MLSATCKSEGSEASELAFRLMKYPSSWEQSFFIRLLACNHFLLFYGGTVHEACAHLPCNQEILGEGLRDVKGACTMP